MMRRFSTAAAIGLCLFCCASPARAFVVKYWCNGSPVPVSTSALNYKYLTASLSVDAQNAASRAIDTEINGLSTVAVLQHYNDPSGTTVTYGNGVNEVARINRSWINGNNGLNQAWFTACVFSSTIIENDVLVADDLEVAPPQDNWVGANVDCRGAQYAQNTGGQCDIGLGAFTFLHEFQHSLNLEHNIGQVVLHAGPPVPFGGTSGGYTSAATFFPDDAAGVRWAIGNVASVRNVMSASTHLASSDSLVTNAAYAAGWGIIYYFCPGFSLPFWTTIVNNGTTNETVGRRVYLTASPSDTNSANGWVFASWFSTTVNSGATYSGSYVVPLPGAAPRAQWLWMHHQVDTGGVVLGTRWADNISSYPYVVSLGTVAQCGL